MAKLDIIKYGNSILRTKPKDISLSDISYNRKTIQTIAYNMIDTMKLAAGIGIAAPQVGILLNLCIVVNPNDHFKQIIMINPKIIFKSNNLNSAEEGCLSIPGIYEVIHRHNKISCKYIDINSCNENIMDATGLFARIIQHEVDHLNSILFIDYLTTYKQLYIKKKLHKQV
ncbi:MAG: peptide deformylase [Endomicrobium sp.]|jgi:peptide deformylase|nr:peptide deformylase [Endomicrobium sp.]